MHTETNEPQINEPRPAGPPRRSRYEACIETSKRVRWDIDKDLLRGRQFDFATTFLPDGLTKVGELPFLGAEDRRLMSQIQGRTYANFFGLVERFINAKVLEVSRDHWLGDQKALEALVRFSDEELKHQELFRRLEEMIGARHARRLSFLPQPDEVATAVPQQVHLGRARPDLPHRAVHPGALPAEHRADRRAVARSSRTFSASIGRRSRNTRSSTSSSGGEKIAS